MNASKPLEIELLNKDVITLDSAQQLKKIELHALHICDYLVSVIHSVLNLCVQFDAEMSRM